MGVTFPRAWMLLALSLLASACYDKPDDKLGVTEADDSSTGASATTSMTSVDASSESGSTSATTATTSSMTMTSSVETTEPMTESGSTAPADSGSSESGPAACDVLADVCEDDTLCDGQSCVAPPEGSVAVPGGAFMMGCNDAVDTDCDPDEYPYHEVTLSSFAIDQTEVSVAMWNECVDAGACPSLPATDWGGNACTYPSDDHPVTCIDWFDAGAYCAWRGGALPTEAQWEKAARSDDGRIYPWGDEAPTCTLAHTSGCGSGSIAVGSKPAGASPYGALDMTGNVSEWVADWYEAAYYVSSPDQDPLGPGSGERRIARSSAPNYTPAHTSSRWGGLYDAPTPESFHVGVGLRCAYVPAAR
ncbi:MAG TPA: SUMF1/EgtB/PvdO family nonheme iron enzyme [Nannocystaceae bacterium]|nr:SUMF1/EgtB/PvdO family nonheme iron enzyme [Nannocystaceae bacterium]